MVELTLERQTASSNRGRKGRQEGGSDETEQRRRSNSAAHPRDNDKCDKGLGEEQEERSRRGREGQQVRRAQMRLSGTGRMDGRKEGEKEGEGDAYAAHFEAGS